MQAGLANQPWPKRDKRSSLHRMRGCSQVPLRHGQPSVADPAAPPRSAHPQKTILARGQHATGQRGLPRARSSNAPPARTPHGPNGSGPRVSPPAHPAATRLVRCASAAAAKPCSLPRTEMSTISPASIAASTGGSAEACPNATRPLKCQPAGWLPSLLFTLEFLRALRAAVRTPKLG